MPLELEKKELIENHSITNFISLCCFLRYPSLIITFIMVLFKSIPFLALFALPALASSSRKCNFRNPTPDGLVCDSLGTSSNKDGKFELSYKMYSAQECADLCWSLVMLGCQTFSYTVEGDCQLYANSMAKLGHTPNTAGNGALPWYDQQCFDCINKGMFSNNQDLTCRD
jgi:hypothetical protein